MNVDIVVYGGGLQAVAAAAKAATFAPNSSILVIVPYTVKQLGGIATVGGQNFWDVRNWNSDLVTKGTFSWFYTFGVGYNTDALADELKGSLAKYSNIEIMYGYDMVGFTSLSSPYRITSLTIRNIYRDTDGNVKWGNASETVNATQYIDASEEGRLARLINSAASTGRCDWPASVLDTGIENSNRVGRQPSATLMFKLKGIDPTVSSSDMNYGYNQNSKAYTVWGGSNTYKTNRTVIDFNNAYGPQGYVIKPINAAQNGQGSDEWWINSLLLFDVDGRANYRDVGTSNYPSYVIAGNKTTDQAWIDARNFLKNNSAFLSAIRQFDGFNNVELVIDQNGYPEVGEVLYLRETIHMAVSSGAIANGTENNNYRLTTSASHNAGNTSTSGGDAGNYATRIGLAYYQADVHPYKYDHLLENGNYIWGYDSYRKIRPDMNIADNDPPYPVYIPYRSIVTDYIANLLLPGYAAGVSSYAWGEVRVFCSLCVMGDAAGVTAAYCINNGKQPGSLTTADISTIQNNLLSIGARLEK